MKALVIENEHEIEYNVSAFLKDNPDLFESVNIQTYCIHRKLEDIGRFIHTSDAIIISTTWLYIDQIEAYIDSFLDGPFKDKNICFYVHDFLHDLNERDKLKQIRDKIIKLLASGRKIYDFKEDLECKDVIYDEFNFFYDIDSPRRPYAYSEIKYNEKANTFE